MGQSNSTPDGQRTKRPSLRPIRSLTGISKRRFNNSKNLSHTFSFPDQIPTPQQLNINTATEEELMTLPGINRNLAENIVSHRRLIGRFARVEDLALVSGIGARKLENIKLEVHVALSNGSGVSSRASTSLNSVGNNGSQVDVNSASIFDLQIVPGVDQELASRIVEKRLKRGCYNSLDELAKLKGMGKYRLAGIKQHLKINGVSNGSTVKSSVETSPSPSWTFPQASSTPRANNVSRKLNQINRELIKPVTMPIIDDNDKSVELSPGISQKEIWELLSIASPRPDLECDFIMNDYSNRTSIRISSWNLSGFDTDKAENLGVMEVVCRTILENRLSLIALQEIKNSEALDKLTHELNVPSLKRVNDWRENSREWKSLHLGAGLAVLWDSAQETNITLKEQPPATTVFLPVVASVVFHVNKVDLTLINVQIHAPEDKNIIERFADAKNPLFVGDFSLANDTANIYNDVLCEENTAVNSEKYLFKDKIIWGKGSKKVFETGIGRVVRQGLTHLGIPQGWKWGGPASNHCPIWCEIFTEPKNP